MTSITYPQNLPAGIPATANVTYGYDEAGNRNLMSDALGNVVTYHYNTLSQLEWEARQFAGLSGTYTLAYEYTDTGQLKKVTDQTAGTSFNYTFDDVGRLSSVNSTGLGATASLASNAQYRASGALKHRDSGNGTGMNLAYNARGLMTQYSLSGVKADNGGARAEGSNYQYHADGRIKFASDLYGRSFYSMSFHDKSYQYDQAGRLQTALTAVQANDFVNGTATQWAASGSYRQTNAFDAWDNLVSREGLYWNEDNYVEPQTYQANNRNYSWAYDADGRLISMYEPPPNELTFIPAMHTYDASGRHVKVTQTTSREMTQLPGHPIYTTIATTDAGYDGGGQQFKRVKTRQGNSQQLVIGTTYYLRSGVLGQVIAEYDEQGVRQKSYVYGGGGLIASSSSSGLLWRYHNPLTGDGRETDAQGKLAAATYLDPDAIDVGATDPANGPSEPGPEPQPMMGAIAAFFPASLGGSGGSCIVDGMEIGCGFANSLIGMGAAAQCPDNNCNPRMTDHGLLPLILTDKGFGFFVPGKKGKKPANPLQKFASDKKLSDEECDKKLSEIFGGFAKAMVTSDLKSPSGRGANGHSAAPRNDLSATLRQMNYDTGQMETVRRADRGGIIHAYTDSNGSKTTGTTITTPAGWTGTPIPYFTSGNSGLIVNYGGGVTIEFVHLGTSNADNIPAVARNVGNSAGLIEIGYAGGKGGEGENYNHTHIVFFSDKAKNERIDPRVLFCGFPKEGKK